MKEYKRILIIRTDRIGDVVLTTPVIDALKSAYPNAHLAMMVTPDTEELVVNNPRLDEVIVYDKNGLHRGFIGNIKFILSLRQKKFDLALILHTKNRINLIAYFAGIPNRIGYYNKKFGFLLTQKLKDTRHLGIRHERDYNLDVVSALGIEVNNKDLFIALDKQAENWADRFLKENHIEANDKIITINPSASCVSKRWPIENFGKLAKEIIEKYSAKIILVSSKNDLSYVNRIFEFAAENLILNLTGKVNLSQLASILRRSRLFISNDSGPVHISTAVKTPVLSIFGRNQRGLSPARWAPLGEKDRAVHKDVGCNECLAHECDKHFICLQYITVDEILKVVDDMLKL